MHTREIEHDVCFVQDEGLDGAGLDEFAPQPVFDGTRRAHNDMGLGALTLCISNAVVNVDGKAFNVAYQPHEAVINLYSELTGRDDDDHLSNNVII